MKERRYGKVVNIASVAGRQGNYDNPPYGISKAGVISFTQAYAVLLAPFNVNVNAICPGSTITAMSTSTMEQRAAEAGLSVDELQAQRASNIPIGRANEPEDIAAMAVFLASPGARNITGQTINVDGGLVMH
jgi:NAD(P)-dependent dehydrogenase (short-subunit alcohol dehydrogenase family)